MTKREYFACHILQGLAACQSNSGTNWQFAVIAVAMADELIAALNGEVK
jgi:hypothetical protein